MTTPSPTVLLDLAERCERATGPDRELDYELAMVAGYTEIGHRVYRDPQGKYYGSAPYYTRSIDAAMTLVPEGAEWECGTAHLVNRGWANVITRDRESKGKAATPALALCAAALRARSTDTVQGE